MSNCPSCGTPLRPASSLAGLCPACLLGQVLVGSGGRDPNADADGSDDLLAPGDTCGRFEIVSVLGQGGMAAVYEAREAPPLERTVALKVLPPAFLRNESFAVRFAQAKQWSVICA